MALTALGEIEQAQRDGYLLPLVEFVSKAIIQSCMLKLHAAHQQLPELSTACIYTTMRLSFCMQF